MVQDGFFVTVLNCAQMLMNGIIKLIYNFCRFIIKYVFLLLDNIVRVIDYPVDMFILLLIECRHQIFPGIVQHLAQ